MPRPIHRLNDKRCKHAKPGKLADGDGLFLRTLGSGSSRWVFQYTRDGRTREMGLGGYPGVTLAKARAEAERNRKHLAAGRDPIEAKTQQRTRKKSQRTFASAAAAYIRAHRRGWANRKHAHQWVSTMKTYARPVIGETEVAAIQVADVLRILQPLWTSKTETAKRVQGRLENIIDFAAAMGWRTGDNPARWRGHLDKLLPSPSKVRKVRHHPALPYAELPAFWSQLAAHDGTAADALRFTILTACRTGEVLGARWDEIDGDVWTIPAERMKAGLAHRVPLSSAALGILESVDRVGDYVFAGRFHDRPISNMTMLKLLQRHMGRGDLTVHGFRSTFRDWAEETTGFPARVCEAALAHTIGDKTVAAYQRGDLFEKRRMLMDLWSSFCISGKALIVAKIA